MLAKLLKTWNELRASFWFVPAIMSIGAVIVSLALTRVDIALGKSWMQSLPWVFHIQAEGARGLLSTVAGSMIGVAGVTFSITIAALAYTTSTLGPRLLSNFMDDTGNQVTLGTFVSTFVYCLLLLRTITSGSGDSTEFVPYLALLFAMMMTGASIVVLIYFIHHVTELLHVSHVTGHVADDLYAAIENYDTRASEGQDKPVAYLPADFTETAIAIRADTSGYIQNLVYVSLMRQATAHDLVLRLERGPGDFAARGQVLLWAWPAARIDDNVAGNLRGAYAQGFQRTASQDVLFLVNELVEIGARALSPGINDPYTAMTCLDWLTAALVRLARHDIAAMHRYDSDDRLRLWLPEFNFRVLALATFDQLRPYFCTDRNASLHMFDRLGSIGEFVRDASQRQLLADQTQALREGALDAATCARDRQAIIQAHRRALRIMSRTA